MKLTTKIVMVIVNKYNFDLQPFTKHLSLTHIYNRSYLPRKFLPRNIFMVKGNAELQGHVACTLTNKRVVRFDLSQYMRRAHVGQPTDGIWQQPAKLPYMGTYTDTHYTTIGSRSGSRVNQSELSIVL